MPTVKKSWMGSHEFVFYIPHDDDLAVQYLSLMQDDDSSDIVPHL